MNRIQSSTSLYGESPPNESRKKGERTTNDFSKSKTIRNKRTWYKCSFVLFRFYPTKLINSKRTAVITSISVLILSFYFFLGWVSSLARWLFTHAFSFKLAWLFGVCASCLSSFSFCAHFFSINRQAIRCLFVFENLLFVFLLENVCAFSLQIDCLPTKITVFRPFEMKIVAIRCCCCRVPNDVEHRLKMAQWKTVAGKWLSTAKR